MYKEPKHIVSSYTLNNIGKTIYDIVRKLKPKKVIEFGALYGYSAMPRFIIIRNVSETFDVIEYLKDFAIQSDIKTSKPVSVVLVNFIVT